MGEGLNSLHGGEIHINLFLCAKRNLLSLVTSKFRETSDIVFGNGRLNLLCVMESNVDFLQCHDQRSILRRYDVNIKPVELRYRRVLTNLQLYRVPITKTIVKIRIKITWHGY